MTVDGPLLLGVAAIITAIDAPIVVLIGKTTAIHKQVNSNLSEAKDATAERAQAAIVAADAVKANATLAGLLAQALAELSEERKATTAATLDASKASIERAAGSEPLREG